MTNGHTIPLGAEVEVIATNHHNVATPCTGWVDDWLAGGYGVNVPVSPLHRWKGYEIRHRETCYFEYHQTRPVFRLLLMPPNYATP